MLEYRLRVTDTEVYEWTNEGEGKHLHNKGGFTLGHFKSIEDAKDELEDFFKTLGRKKVYKTKDVKNWLGY